MGKHFAGSEAKRTTPAEAIDRFKREKLPSLNGQADRLRYLDFWAQELGEYALSDVAPKRINEAMHKLASTPSERTHKPRSAATLGQYRQALSGVLALCEREWELIEASPMKRVSKPKYRVDVFAISATPSGRSCWPRARHRPVPIFTPP